MGECELKWANPPSLIGETDDEGCSRFDLPVYVRVEVLHLGEGREPFLIVSSDKKDWNEGGDGLTASAGDDFNYRTQVFGEFPNNVRDYNGCGLNVGEWNELAMVISETKAIYWINGRPRASIVFEEGDLPTVKPFIGLGTWTGAPIRARGFDLSRDPEKLALLNDICH